ncbi:hypothetical protein AB0I06_08535 [Streptomyces sp. NPDC050674]|uniref:hypothetical protein n=1 Tax=Streptomyces sp. NPDC050674 TaxID=3157216 RepID=UPI0034386B18
MGLRSMHLGYAYQDLLTALRLMDLAVGHAGDRGHEDVRRGPVDDITCEWGTGSHERLQIKHTDHDRALSAESFIKDSRGLCLELPFSSIDRDLTSQPAASHRLVVRDTEPDDADLMRVLRPAGTAIDPGPALVLGSGRRPSAWDAGDLGGVCVPVLGWLAVRWSGVGCRVGASR